MKTWVAVKVKGSPHIAKDQYNLLQYEPVKTTAMKWNCSNRPGLPPASTNG